MLKMIKAKLVEPDVFQSAKETQNEIKTESKQIFVCCWWVFDFTQNTEKFAFASLSYFIILFAERLYSI